MHTYQEQLKKTFDSLKERFGYGNTMESPRLEKIVVSSGVGKVQDAKKIELIQDRLAKITGQKAAPRGAKKSVASFKVRQGDVVGYQVTLRGSRMQDFFEKLVHVAFPRTRDFRGIKPSAIDELGNITIGIPEHTIFPETSDEEFKDVFGLSVTIVTSARSKEEAEAFLRHLGLPLRVA